MASILFRLERAGALTVCRSAADMRDAMAKGSIAAVFHIEGVEAIDPELTLLDVLYAAGLRSLGIVWSRPNAFGHGVPFRFPSSPDTGPGLTDAGKALVKACNRAEDHDRSLASQREGLSRCRRAQRCAAGRHPFQRACDLRRIRAI